MLNVDIPIEARNIMGSVFNIHEFYFSDLLYLQEVLNNTSAEILLMCL